MFIKRKKIFLRWYVEIILSFDIFYIIDLFKSSIAYLDYINWTKYFHSSLFLFASFFFHFNSILPPSVSFPNFKKKLFLFSFLSLLPFLFFPFLCIPGTDIYISSVSSPLLSLGPVSYISPSTRNNCL